MDNKNIKPFVKDRNTDSEVLVCYNVRDNYVIKMNHHK